MGELGSECPAMDYIRLLEGSQQEGQPPLGADGEGREKEGLPARQVTGEVVQGSLGVSPQGAQAEPLPPPPPQVVRKKVPQVLGAEGGKVEGAPGSVPLQVGSGGVSLPPLHVYQVWCHCSIWFGSRFTRAKLSRKTTNGTNTY